MQNKVILQGNIGHTPKFYLTQEGKEMATFSLATTQNWKDTTGEWQSVTEWHQIAVFRDSTIGWMKTILKRGDTVYVEGKLSYHHWTDRYGQKRLTPHVVISRRDGCVQRLVSLVSNNKRAQLSNGNSEDQTASSDSQVDEETSDVLLSQEKPHFTH